MIEWHSKRPRAGGSERRSKARFRCAVYTRKSSDEGLEQSLNSLHAQRDACEAYIASQKHEGWILLPEAYDDGGLSGGSMDRPALQKLLADIRLGLIDIIVVYKVDRLTRSLADFAKLTELFDKRDASFVSVTQHFNTSTSMGRLTLNVLLSFAQFEREVAGERIRDKIALSKRRGMWMGGLPPLGYDGIDGKLVVNKEEAETVRFIYGHYLEAGSVAELKRKLDAQGVVSKQRIFKDGKRVGGVPISRGALYQILRNHLYRGEIAYREEVYAGNHDPIVDSELWDAAQQKLLQHSSRSRHSKDAGRQGQSSSTSTALLAGLAFDTEGNRLSPSYAVKRAKRYSYYVSAPLVRGEPPRGGIRVPAADLEQLVLREIGKPFRDEIWLLETFGKGLDADHLQHLLDASHLMAKQILSRTDRKTEDTDQVDSYQLRAIINRIIVNKRSISITLDANAVLARLSEINPVLSSITLEADTILIDIAAHRLRCGKQVKLVVGQVETESRKIDHRLVKLIVDARRWFEALKSGRRASIAEIARKERRQVSEVSRGISLAFLALDIVEMILRGAQPITLTPERLKACRPLPLDWTEQRALLLDE